MHPTKYFSRSLYSLYSIIYENALPSTCYGQSTKACSHTESWSIWQESNFRSWAHLLDHFTTASAAFLHIIGSYKLQVYNYSLFSCYNPWFSLPPAESGKVDLVPKVQGITGSSTLSKEKKLTLPSVAKQISKGMPPHCLSRASISALDGWPLIT